MDFINRQDAIDAIDRERKKKHLFNTAEDGLLEARRVINTLPSAQPTLYGYNIEHLVLIAKLLEKENLSPEKVSDALYDIGRVVAIVKKEFEETMKKAVEQCIT